MNTYLRRVTAGLTIGSALTLAAPAAAHAASHITGTSTSCVDDPNNPGALTGLIDVSVTGAPWNSSVTVSVTRVGSKVTQRGAVAHTPTDDGPEWSDSVSFLAAPGDYFVTWSDTSGSPDGEVINTHPGQGVTVTVGECVAPPTTSTTVPPPAPSDSSTTSTPVPVSADPSTSVAVTAPAPAVVDTSAPSTVAVVEASAVPPVTVQDPPADTLPATGSNSTPLIGAAVLFLLFGVAARKLARRPAVSR